MCGGFNCLRNALISLNVWYIIAGIVLFCVSEKFNSSYSDNLPVTTGIRIYGTFLIGLALLGLAGAIKHHQSWINMDTKSKRCFMQDFHCCSFDEKIPSEFATHDPLCFNIPCCKNTDGQQCTCPKCGEKLIATIRYVFNVVGQFGAFFSFTEVFGVWLTKRYRNQKDPRAHPSAFL
ncbi:hypothetical protein PGB90_007547 [Kerria lacca]